LRKLLITGVSGGQGRLVATRALGSFEVSGVDREAPAEGGPRGTRIYVVDLMRRKFEDVIRQERPDAVVHLAFVRHFKTAPATRHKTNVEGTRRLLEYCVEYGVRQLVVLSSAYAYGALPDNPNYMSEDAPLNVSRTYPEVRDLAEVDTLCSSFLWQHPEVRTAILRPVNTLGDSVHSAIGAYLSRDYVPTLMGFDPLMQFLHEDDLATAILLAVTRRLRGVFNITGPGAVPLHTAIRASGATALPLPEFLLRHAAGRLFDLGLYPLPAGAIDFIKYPCTVSGERFEGETGFRPRWDLPAIFEGLRLARIRDGV
jgi:UDP-glucose 4-epimerase